nr:phosphoribosylformylglycinamidine cyclo-ligase [Actinomycetota bacterium]
GAAEAAASTLSDAGIATWRVGTVHDGPRPEGSFEQGAKGVDGGAVRLVGGYAEAGAK